MPSPSPNVAHYIGGELALFEHATQWKAYYGGLLRPYLEGRVLEVGAGMGSTTRALNDGRAADWLCVEPDAELAARISALVAERALPPACRVFVGTLAELPAAEGRFDAILYVNVVEHIADDAAELARAYDRLAPGGTLLILVPAHQWLFGPFDAAIGHLRRYSRTRLRQVLPAGGHVRRLVYLDSLSLLGVAFSQLLLHQTYPSPAQIKFWDRAIVPISRILDQLTGYTVGKSVLAVVEKPA